MASLSVRKLSKQFGATPVIRGIDIEIRDGEFVALVGPSGCGKSTLLRTIAGLESADDGEIYLGDRRINDAAPRDRDVAMVFQNYALYPHMTVEQNLGFGLKIQGMAQEDVTRRVRQAADTLGLGDLLHRRPRQLSGGQRQRVAMGRAIVRKPKAFLFDEPLSNLDAKLRVQMRTEIKSLQQRLGTTTVYVTHDQVEAMTMADRIVVLKEGRIEQVGSPLELYDRPRNVFVAGFIGSPAMNFIHGHLGFEGGAHVRTEDGLRLPLAESVNGEPGEPVIYGVRPEHFAIDTNGQGIEAEVLVVEPTGSETQVALRLGRQQVIAAFRDRIHARPGDRLALSPVSSKAHVFDANGVRRPAE
ncbi:ABC transporter ATP-binding protein [Xylophilus sp.]|uniref:ABC transporter ATP-binding protein n=1 Tax=Xylophilus sp. TaxID=2653893 RepID=UPI0013B899E5|nr:sn-glycerol-3-phosphate ABC transporter ATP-binding protein UgpC [Xylophilus sp.]KAF1044550.1 MAG: sn-glycerol-3-phosphate import ATP-binding protein UgpC [Xylophilus sp.]